MTRPSALTEPSSWLLPGSGATLAVPAASTVGALRTGSRVERVWALVTPRGGAPVELPIDTGTRRGQAGQSPRWSLSAHLAGLDDWVPRDATDLLHPDAGATVDVWASLASPRTPAVEYRVASVVPDRATVSQGEAGVEISLTCVDVLARLGRRLMRAHDMAQGGEPVEQAVARVLTGRDPSVRVDTSTSLGVVSSTRWIGTAGADPVAACDTLLARPLGARLVVDTDGVVRLRRLADPLILPPVVTWATTAEGARALLDVQHDLSPTPTGMWVPWTVNGWLQGPALVGQDTGPMLMYSGDTSILASEAEALTAGEAQWAIERGKGKSSTVSAIFDPVVGLDDVVRVVAPDVGMDVRARVESISHDLRSSVMQLDLVDRRDTDGS